MARENVAVEVTLQAATKQYIKAMEEAEKATKGFTKELGTGRVKDFNQGLADLQKGALAIAAATASMQQLVAGVVDAGLAFNRLNSALTVATGSATAAREEYGFLSRTAEELGLNLRTVGQDYASFAAAARGTAIEGEETRKIFISVSEAATALGLTADDASGLFTAFTQILSKGVVQAEELTGQIGERLPGSLAIASRALGVTTTQLLAMIENGEVLADEFIPRFAEQLSSEFGDVAREAADGPQAAFNRLSNAIYETQVALAESGILDAIAALAEGTAVLVGESGKAVALIRQLGAEAAFYVDALGKLASGDLEGIARGWEVLGEQVADYWEQADRAANRQAESSKKNFAELKNRLKLEQEIAVQRQQISDLESQRIIENSKEETKATKDVLQEKIKAANSASSAKKKELDKGLKAEKEYVDKIKKLREELVQATDSHEKEMADLRIQGAEEAQKQAQVEVESSELINKARRALREGDYERARALSEEAKTIAKQLEDTNKIAALFEDANKIQIRAKQQEILLAEKALEAQKKANAETRKEFEESKNKVTELKVELEELTEPKTVTIDADISAAQARIRELQAQVDRLNQSLASGGRAGGGPIGFATGGAPRHLTPGLIRGPGTSTSDSILARVSAGEHAFVTKASRAKQLWPLLNALNFGSDSFVRDVLANMPAGLRSVGNRAIPGGSRLATGGVASGGTPVTINVDAPGARQAELFGERDQVENLADALARYSRAYTS